MSNPDSVSDSTMSKDTKKPSGWVSFWRKVYRPLGFQKGYNFPLFVIFAGAMFGFVLARLSYLNISGSSPSSFASGSAPGEWYWYSVGHYKIGITIHLATILPAGLLLVWQFIPVIRHKALLFHRINGYIIVLLVLVSNIGALMIVRRAFGGTLETQAGVGVLVILTTGSIFMAYYNIKRLQIDQHRAWMLRMSFYLGTIITLRIVMIISSLIIAGINSYDSIMTCNQIESMYGSAGPLMKLYPQCNTTNLSRAHEQPVIVHASWAGGPEGIGASFDLSFGMAMWISIFLHVVGVEIYLALTPREANRLRQVSYERQVEQGFKHPGSAGLTVDRWGDADPWVPQTSKV